MLISKRAGTQSPTNCRRSCATTDRQLQPEINHHDDCVEAKLYTLVTAMHGSVHMRDVRGHWLT